MATASKRHYGDTNGHFLGEIISDIKDGGGRKRISGAEMVINNPEEFKVRKKVTRKNRRVMEWVPMRKGVAYPFRYREASQQANYRYMDALVVVDDPTPAIQQLDDITARKQTASGRGVRGFNLLSRDDI
jgi:hypothetical protein